MFHTMTRPNCTNVHVTQTLGPLGGMGEETGNRDIWLNNVNIQPSFHQFKCKNVKQDIKCAI